MSQQVLVKISNTKSHEYSSSGVALFHANGRTDGCTQKRLIKVKVKVKFTPEQTMKAQMGSRGMDLHFL
jgi:hypothetical protein